MRRYIYTIATIAILGTMMNVGWGQPWTYDFGTGTGSFTASASTTFLPTPVSGTARVRIGTGSGSFNLENPGLPNFGSESELRGVAPTGSSVNKISLYDYTGDKSFTIKFTLRFGGGSSGNWYFFNGDGNIYSDNNAFSGTQVFTGIKWVFGANDQLTTYYRNSGSWTELTDIMNAQNTSYVVEIWGNNTNNIATYTYNGSQSVSVNKFDFWVNGILVGDDLSKAQLVDNANIDSWLFYGEGSTGNVANIYIDDIYYTNSIYTDGSLPVSLTSFAAQPSGNAVSLTWVTESEIENQGFNLYRKLFGGEYALLSSFLDNSALVGQGTTTQKHVYAYTDRAVQPGATYVYQLADVDYAGKETKHKEVEVKVEAESKGLVGDYRLRKVYPNPFNASFTIPLELGVSLPVDVRLYDVSGACVRTISNEVLSAGTYHLTTDTRVLPSGIYLLRMRVGNQTETQKIVLMK